MVNNAPYLGRTSTVSPVHSSRPTPPGNETASHWPDVKTSFNACVIFKKKGKKREKCSVKQTIAIILYSSK